MLVSLATLVLLHRAQGIGTRVTYTTRAARAEVVLPELGMLAGVDLQASPQTANEILVISVKDVPLSEILPRIATATTGEWKHDGDTIRLMPNRAARNREDADEVAFRIAVVKEAIATRTENLERVEKGMAGDLTDASEIASTKLNNAQERLITSLLNNLDPVVLASSDDRMVFATTPNAKQRPLGSGAVDEINAFIAEYDRLIATLPKERDESGATVSSGPPPIGKIAKVLLIKDPTPKHLAPAAVRFNLRFYNATGKVVFADNSSENVYLPSVEISTNELTKPPAAKIDYARTSVELMSALARGYVNTGYLAIKPELWQMLMHPLRFDPLSYFQSDEALSYAKAKGKPFVADIPDEWVVEGPTDGSAEWGGAVNFSGGSLRAASGQTFLRLPTGDSSGQTSATVDSVASSIDSSAFEKAIDDPGFTVLKPSRPSVSREIRVDRRSLARLVAATLAKGIPSADDLVAFAVENPAIDDNYQFARLLAIVAPPLNGGNADWLAYRFLGELSGEQRGAAKSGIKLGFKELSPRQLSLAERIAYGGSHNILVTSEASEGDTLLFNSFDELDYRTEPTEVAPVGLTGPGFIDFSSSRETFASRVEENGLQGVFSSSDLAQAIYSRSQPDDPNTPPFGPGKLQLGEYGIFTFFISFRPDTTLNWSVCDYAIDKKSRIYTESDLPADFRKEVDDQLSSMRDAQQTAQADGKVIPP